MPHPAASRAAGVMTYILSVALVVMVVAGAGTISTAEAAKVGPEEVKPRITAIFEAYLRRPLTSAEAAQVYAEAEKTIGDPDADTLKELESEANILRNEDGKPAALHLRHEMIQNAVTNPKRQFIAKLITPLDPVAVYDPKHHELMTESDVRAFINILRFSRPGSDPVAIAKAAGDNDAKLVALVKSELLTSIREGSRLPEMMRDASAFWAGLAQNWTALTPAEQAAARAYVEKNMAGRLTQLPEPLYARLMGWSSFEIKMARLHKTIAVGQMYTALYSRMIGIRSLHLDNNPFR